jgi:NCAIR mutase (PurE)-related protein
MNEQTLRHLLDAVKTGRTTIDAAFHRLRSMPFEDLGFAKIDHHREIRCGFPEVIYCEGKTTPQVIAIMERRLAGGGDLLATRALPETARAVKRRFRKARYNPIARTITVRRKLAQVAPGFVAIACAGTSDLPVAEEARETCEIMGQPTRQFYDVGVAGIHRLLAHSAEIQQARAVVVCAGMEGALASVVGGLVHCPVIGVPTSVGYGANFGGIAPLLTMLNSCAAGVSVVNIDNGFGAGYIAALIGRACETATPANDTQARPVTPRPRKAGRKTKRK